MSRNVGICRHGWAAIVNSRSFGIVNRLERDICDVGYLCIGKFKALIAVML